MRRKSVLFRAFQLVVMRQPSGYQRETRMSVPLPVSIRVPVMISAAAVDWRGSGAPRPVSEMAFASVEFSNNGHRTVHGMPVYESTQDVWQ